jgi:hypothetical protein
MILKPKKLVYNYRYLHTYTNTKIENRNNIYEIDMKPKSAMT